MDTDTRTLSEIEASIEATAAARAAVEHAITTTLDAWKATRDACAALEEPTDPAGEAWRWQARRARIAIGDAAGTLQRLAGLLEE